MYVDICMSMHLHKPPSTARMPAHAQGAATPGPGPGREPKRTWASSVRPRMAASFASSRCRTARAEEGVWGCGGVGRGGAGSGGAKWASERADRGMVREYRHVWIRTISQPTRIRSGFAVANRRRIRANSRANLQPTRARAKSAILSSCILKERGSNLYRLLPLTFSAGSVLARAGLLRARPRRVQRAPAAAAARPAR